MACVRARVAGEPLPDPPATVFLRPPSRLSVEDVPYTPPGGRSGTCLPVRWTPSASSGAEPDIRQVMVGNARVPYFQGGRAYQPYAAATSAASGRWT